VKAPGTPRSFPGGGATTPHALRSETQVAWVPPACLDQFCGTTPSGDAPAKVAPTTPDGTEPWKLEGLTAEEITEVRAEVERLMVEAVGR